MSRWMIPFWWACWTAWQTWHEQLQPLAQRQSWCSSQYSVIGTPATNSMTKYGRPAVGRAGVEHLGDVRMVHQRQACRSASKRAMTCRVSMPGLMILSATVRRIGSSCSAMKTTPMPPSPICCSSL